MKKLRFTAAVAALSLLAASQVSLADPVSSLSGQMPDGAVIPVARGGGGGGVHAGGAAMGHAGPSFSGYVYGGRIGMGRAGHAFRHGRGFARGPFIGFWDYGPYYDGGSCYWNCRESGYGPAYCRANAWEFCG